MTLLILRPDRAAVTQFHIDATKEYPLDSILVVPVGGDQLDALSLALRIVRSAPWFAIAVRKNTNISPVVLLELDERGPAIARIQSHDHGQPDTEQIREAVRGRGPPTAAHMRGLIERRLSSEAGSVVERAITGSVLSRSERKTIRECGPLDEAEWRKLFKSLQLIGDFWNSRDSLESVARRGGTTPKTVWSWSKELWTMGWREVSSRDSWEGLVEEALRRAVWRRRGPQESLVGHNPY